MARLPRMVHALALNKRQQVVFGGYNHTLGAGDGELFEMTNLTSDHFPLLSSRAARRRIGVSLMKPNGFFARDVLMWVDGTDFYYDGEIKGTVADSEKTFCSMGAMIIIFPDKVFYNTLTGVFDSMEKTYQGAAGQIRFGSFTGENNLTINDCALVTTGGPFDFKAGDAVTVSGCGEALKANNKTAIIREISGDKKTLVFYENTFTPGEESGAVAVARTVPDMDFLCENGNRLWGCKGDSIFASKLGDPTNFNVFDGLSTDSYAVDVGSAGDFTAAVSYLGYAMFFKEDAIHKVYGSRPSNYEVITSMSLGVAKGSEKSLAVAGETLFYLSRTGIVAYAGGIPVSLAAPFGQAAYADAIAGSDGQKYFVSVVDKGGGRHLFVYDTTRRLWMREDDVAVIDFGWRDGLYFLNTAGEIWLCSGEAPTGAAVEEEVAWEAVFAPFSDGSADKKAVHKILIRMELGIDAVARVDLRYDSGAQWQEAARLSGARKKTHVVPLLPRRSDHYELRVTGTGPCQIYSLTREYEDSSER